MSSDRENLLHSVRMALRALLTAAEALDDAVGARLGLNRTDMRCVDILSRRAPMTAGDLAREAGLSTGAMTTALDRLERTGYARRIVDPRDRRRVLIELTPAAIARCDAIYGPLIERGAANTARFDDAELAAIEAYLANGARVAMTYVAELRGTLGEPDWDPDEAAEQP